MWTWSLKCTLRSLLRTLLRGLWARILLPGLLANERSAVRLNESIARRARRLGVQVDGDGTRLCHADRGAPLLTKHALRQHPERFVRPRGPGSLLRNTIRTSGTSGTPLTLVQAWSAVIREEAFLQRQLRWIGWRPGGRRAWIRGDIVCPAHPADGRYWCHDRFGRMLMMSSYHLSQASIGAYIDALESYDPVVIQAYPSSIAALASWLDAGSAHYRGRALRGVLTSSETLEPGCAPWSRHASACPSSTGMGRPNGSWQSAPASAAATTCSPTMAACSCCRWTMAATNWWGPP
ncbi:hypothetical protein [Massilia sp. Dwa41.01b]|uniref:hypothetical protein n=1 Tax=Massilia sp. Dwa41.01b TaxID=2709302 RepID=UPI001E419B24|nr:hypothetical protein [Massilia sp. Dwa41.01b]